MKKEQLASIKDIVLKKRLKIASNQIKILSGIKSKNKIVQKLKIEGSSIIVFTFEQSFAKQPPLLYSYIK